MNPRDLLHTLGRLDAIEVLLASKRGAPVAGPRGPGRVVR